MIKINKKLIASLAITFSFLGLSTTYGVLNNQIDVHAADKTSKNIKKVQKMNLNKIKDGNYRSIKGNWHEVASYSPQRTSGELQIGGTDVMKVTNSQISGAGIKMSGDTLTDNSDSHELSFKKNNRALSASLKDADTSNNYSVTFYLKGTTNEFNEDNKKNSQNLIVVWTSNNNYTEVFAK